MCVEGGSEGISEIVVMSVFILCEIIPELYTISKIPEVYTMTWALFVYR